jgi:hypothetical protein
MISPTKEGANMETTGINFDSISTMNLDECQALLASILSGNLKAKDGLLVQVEKAQGGPRGPTAKVQPRLEACQALMVQMAGRPEGVTAKELLDGSNGSFLYTDILLVARNLMESGTIQENRKGRKATWNLTTTG